MLRSSAHTATAGALLAGALTSVRAEDVPQRRPAALRLDLSRSVTLTGHELQAYIKAQVLAVQAQEAAQEAASVSSKLRDAFTVSAETSEPAPAKEWS